MSEVYNAYAVSSDDHIVLRIDFVCESDDAAKQHAAHLVDGYSIELWKGAAMLARFEPLQ